MVLWYLASARSAWIPYFGQRWAVALVAAGHEVVTGGADSRIRTRVDVTSSFALQRDAFDQREAVDAGTADRQYLDQGDTGLGEVIIVGLQDVAACHRVAGLTVGDNKWERLVRVRRGVCWLDM